ncbi:hypothetical protein LRAMOSA04769 [Lichtheimia ramosa]|uniref:Heterokaryon incompatibility domain-containing protein n=1 Tax=Lichtheimia ramosa TaxID=688394 RepID=A0A077WZ63_9FUNG|nr:hypothetical protein LRAMOSA04769 [Lichtheimia ramosa]
MTYETDLYDDAFTIDIRIRYNPKNESAANHKALFEEGLGRLLTNPSFLLLYVPENGAKMQIIQPARNREHRKRMIKRINEAKGIPSFYYALSHLWGVIDEKQYRWNDISQYVDDEKGQPVEPVCMRPEKRDTLLTMLKDHPDSYWWIDVLCARTDTSLDIMGDIYACCLECVAMIDCEPDLIQQINMVKESLPMFYPFNLKYARCLFDEKFAQLVDLFLVLKQSQWWNRVWTWQEMVLPIGNVRLIAETGTDLPLAENTITLDDLCHPFSERIKLMVDFAYTAKVVKEYHQLIQDAKRVKEWLDHIIKAKLLYNGLVSNRCIFLSPVSVLVSLIQSTRQCMDPVDYVYGVIGIFQIKMPRMKDPNAVWQLFLSKLQDSLNRSDRRDCPGYTIRISDRAHQVDLLKVENMADVYEDFLAFEKNRLDH